MASYETAEYTIIASSNEFCSSDCPCAQAQPNTIVTLCSSGSKRIGAQLNGSPSTFQLSDDRFVGDVDLPEGTYSGLDGSNGLT